MDAKWNKEIVGGSAYLNFQISNLPQIEMRVESRTTENPDKCRKHSQITTCIQGSSFQKCSEQKNKNASTHRCTLTPNHPFVMQNIQGNPSSWSSPHLLGESTFWQVGFASMSRVQGRLHLDPIKPRYLWSSKGRPQRNTGDWNVDHWVAGIFGGMGKKWTETQHEVFCQGQNLLKEKKESFDNMFKNKNVYLFHDILRTKDCLTELNSTSFGVSSSQSTTLGYKLWTTTSWESRQSPQRIWAMGRSCAPLHPQRNGS